MPSQVNRVKVNNALQMRIWLISWDSILRRNNKSAKSAQTFVATRTYADIKGYRFDSWSHAVRHEIYMEAYLISLASTLCKIM